MLMRSCFALLSCLLLAQPAIVRAKPSPRPNEIIVSAANYAQTPPEVLEKLFRDPAELTDLPPPAPAARPLQHYQFLPGEVLESDLTYLEVCKLLVPALAKKNLVNTFDQAKVGLVLRVSFGGRLWRDPFVREGDLEWKHGLVPRRRGSSASLGATAAWDERAGGDEAALHQTEQFLTELNPTGGAEGMADRLIGGMHTEDYFLVVVDAFDVAALRAKGSRAPRAWTTFIAVPRQGKTKFSDIAAAMIAKAAPYFGETLPGKARFIDRQGTVTTGELQIIEENVRPKDSPKIK